MSDSSPDNTSNTVVTPDKSSNGPPAAPTSPTSAAPPAIDTPPIPLREDLLKQAVSFLSSPKVIPQDKAKKIAFLQKKGLTQPEIDESFNRANTDTPVSATATTTTTQNAPVMNSLPPVIPPRNITYAPPQIIYQPLPPAPLVPIEKVFALAIVLGLGAVGITSGIIGILKHQLSPVFNAIGKYQQDRYKQYSEFTSKLLQSMKDYHKDSDDLDVVMDQGEEKLVLNAISKRQDELADRINSLAALTKGAVDRKNAYDTLRSDMISFSQSVTAATDNHPSYSPASFRSVNENSPAVSGLKSEIRGMKAMLLNRRNFPTV